MSDIASLQIKNQNLNLSERFMAPFAMQASNNEVVGIDAFSLVQRLMLFDHCIIQSIWLRDIQLLLRSVDADALCDLIDAKAFSIYIDSATAGETGQAHRGLNLTGNTTHLQDNEFLFSTLKGKNDPEKVKQAINDLASTEGISRNQAKSVAERIEAAILEPKGLELHAKVFKEFYSDLRSDSKIIHSLIARRLRLLGAKPRRLQASVEEFVDEDFRVISNLTTTFGLSSQKARQITLKALFDLLSVHIRLAHMREFTCISGMNESEEEPWKLKVDSLISSITAENQMGRQFTRVARIAGLGERHLLGDGRIDLRRLISLRQSEDLTLFKVWLKKSDQKSDEEIRQRVAGIRGLIGNSAHGPTGKTIRLMMSSLTGLIPDPLISFLAGLGLGAADSFLLERLFPEDPVLSVIGQEYPSILGK